MPHLFPDIFIDNHYFKIVLVLQLCGERPRTGWMWGIIKFSFKQDPGNANICRQMSNMRKYEIFILFLFTLTLKHTLRINIVYFLLQMLLLNSELMAYFHSKRASASLRAFSISAASRQKFSLSCIISSRALVRSVIVAWISCKCVKTKTGDNEKQSPLKYP